MMLDWLIDQFFAFLKSFPALFTEEGSPNFLLARAMLGLILIVLLAYLITLPLFRSLVAEGIRKLKKLRHP
jgi:hypothetical protein